MACLCRAFKRASTSNPWALESLPLPGSLSFSFFDVCIHFRLSPQRSPPVFRVDDPPSARMRQTRAMSVSASVHSFAIVVMTKSSMHVTSPHFDLIFWVVWEGLKSHSVVDPQFLRSWCSFELLARSFV